MKINDRIYWISGGPWGYLGNAYAIKHSNGYVLVDTGSPEALDVIVKKFKNIGILMRTKLHMY